MIRGKQFIIKKSYGNILIPPPEITQRPQVRTKLSAVEKQNARELKKIPNQTFHKDRKKPVEVFVTRDDGNIELDRIRKKDREVLETMGGVEFGVSSGRTLDGIFAHVWAVTPCRREEYRRQELIRQILKGLPCLPGDLQAAVALEAGMGRWEAECLIGLDSRLEPRLMQQSSGTLTKLARDVHQAATAEAEDSPGPGVRRCA